ncbi:MAG: ComEC/Rec2 family competence protein [Patescibacteria group bacterium]|nr:ComEC/Rec2 family competence protein [Patescibacteria group bacterium]
MAIGDIAFGLAAGFLNGILSAALGWNLALDVGILSVGCLAALIISRRLRFSQFFLVFLVSVPMGAFYYHAYLHWKAAADRFPDPSAVFTAVISDEPKISGNSVYFSANLRPPFSGMLAVFASASDTFHYGDLIEAKGPIQPGRMPGGRPAVFSKAVVVFGAHQGFWLREKMIAFKEAIEAEFREFLSVDAAALLGGMTFGGTSGMSKGFKDEMAASGTSYVASMYGAKIFYLAWAIEQSLKRRLMRRTRFFVAAAAVILFVAMAGASLVVVRAALIAFLGLLAKEIGRRLSKRNALAVIGAGMAIFDPTIIIQPVFTLSFLSVAGILYLDQPLRIFLGWRGKGGGFLKWRESVIIAAAVLLAIIPVLVAGSGQEFSLAIFPSNALIGISLPFAIGFGYSLAFAGFVLRYLGAAVAAVGSVILWYDFAIIKIFAAFTLPLPIGFNSIIPFVIYYAALAGFAYFYRERVLSARLPDYKKAP